MHKSPVHDVADADPPGPIEDYAAIPRYPTVYLARKQPAGTVVALPATLLAVKTTRDGTGYRLTAQDLGNGEQFDSMPLPDDEDIIDQTFEAARKGYRVVLFGRFPKYPKGHDRYDGPTNRMEILDVRLLTSQVSLLCPKTDEHERSRVFAQDLIDRGAVLTWLIDEARDHLHVETQYLSRRFLAAERLTCLQALSFAQVERGVNSRLSMFFTAGPSTGKSKLADYVELYAARSDYLQPSTLSLAGMGAAVSSTKTGFTARPGVMPTCSFGSCIVDDMHRIDRGDINDIEALLMAVTEDGLIRMAKAGQGEYESRTAIYIASNRLSIRGRVGDQTTEQGRTADLMSFDLFTRVDVSWYLGAGDDAVRSAMKLASSKAHRQYELSEDENRPAGKRDRTRDNRERFIKLVVAWVKDLIPVVDFGQIEEKLEQITLETGIILREYTARVKGVSQESYDGDNLARRMSNSMRKLVGALARGSGRSVAIEADCEAAWDLLRGKLEIVRYMVGDTEQIETIVGSRAQLVDIALAASARRWERIVELLGGQKVKLDSVMLVGDCNDKTARRELQKRGVHPDGIWYQIPTQAQERQRPRQRDLQAELAGPPPDTGVDDVPLEKQIELPPRLTFTDCLPTPPPEAKNYVEEMATMDYGTRIYLSGMIFMLAMAHRPDEYERLVCEVGLTYVNWAARQTLPVDEEGEPVGDTPDYDPVLSQQADVLMRWLYRHDWGERVERALGLYAAIGLLYRDNVEEQVDRLIHGRYRRQPDTPPLPERAQAALSAMLERRKQQDESDRVWWVERVARQMAEKKQREEEQKQKTPLYRYEQRIKSEESPPPS